MTTLLCAAALSSWAAPSSAQTERRDTAGARQFAQAFYDWYVPIALGQHRPAELAIQQRPALFDQRLLSALRENFTAGSDKGGEYDVLSFDPFLASQDPCEKYQVGASVSRGGHVRVEVHTVCRGKVSASPRVVAVLRRTPGSWQFVDFDYPGTGKPENLLGVLNDLKRLHDRR